MCLKIEGMRQVTYEIGNSIFLRKYLKKNLKLENYPWNKEKGVSVQPISSSTWNP